MKKICTPASIARSTKSTRRSNWDKHQISDFNKIHKSRYNKQNRMKSFKSKPNAEKVKKREKTNGKRRNRGDEFEV